MTPEKALERATRAEQLMRDDLLVETLNLMEKDVTEAWMTCPVRDHEGREELWRMAVTTRKFRDLLRGTMESGKMAVEEIRRKQSMLDRAKNGIRRAVG